MRTKYVRWFLDELDGLCQEQVLTPEVADQLREHYRRQTVSDHRIRRNLVLGVMGALLIGGGVILLLAHNWSDLGRPVRAFIALIPVAISLAATGHALIRRTDSAPWREATGTALSLSMAAAIALISQTYHLTELDFLLTWALLTLPIVYLLQACVPSMLYLGTILCWAHGEPAYGYWLLLAAILPFLALTWRQTATGRGIFLGWCMAVSLPIAVGLTFDGMEEIWPYTFSFLFAGMALWGIRRQPEVRLGTPLALTGVLGVMGTAYFFAFQLVQKALGPFKLKIPLAWVDGKFQADEATTWVLLAALVTGTLGLFVQALSERRIVAAILGGFPLLVTLSMILSWGAGPATLAYNLFLGGLSLMIIAEGLRDNRSGWAYLGLSGFNILVLTRFFDSELPLALRGLAFLIIGIAFLVVNRTLNHRSSESLSPVLGEA